MKKILIALFVLPLFFACSSDDKEDESNIKYIQFYAKYDNTTNVSYEAYIYKGDLSDYKSFNTGHYKLPATARDVNEELVFPINLSDGEMMDDSSNMYNGYAVSAFYPKRYETLPNGRYTFQFVINVHGKGYFQCIKSFDINSKTVIRLKFSEIIDLSNKSIDGDWQIVDATQSGFRELIDFK